MISDPRDPVIRRVADVLRQQSAPKRQFVVDDVENILQARASGVEIATVFAVDDPGDLGPVTQITDEVATSLFGREKRSRVFALAKAPRPSRLSDLAVARGDVVVLDGVRMAGNIGAIIRTATALGGSGVVLLGSGLASALDRRIVRASRGMVFALPVVLSDAVALREFLRDARMPLVALQSGADALPVTALADAPERVAMLFGSERAGPSADVLDIPHTAYAIEMREGVESLNVSVAAGIALHERWRGVRRGTAQGCGAGRPDERADAADGGEN